ncbi:class I SAM-dependent methyltransferase [Kribbella amoyensis]|nr:class I SAM-dependent methyltransferase [Kribbella amoyensis]
MKPYEVLVEEAVSAGFSGWDFRWLEGRASSASPSWSYPEVAAAALGPDVRLLDIDTGGGELLASFAPLPKATIATEGYAPNVPIARDRLGPLGVEVREHPAGEELPVEDGGVDVVLNRHGRLDVPDLARVLRSGGLLVTQQVGSGNDAELNEILGAPPPIPPGSFTGEGAVRALADAGFEILEAAEEFPEFVLHDIGAVVFQLRAIPWQIPDFDLDRYDTALRRLDHTLRTEGPLVVHDRRYLVRARRR